MPADVLRHFLFQAAGCIFPTVGGRPDPEVIMPGRLLLEQFHLDVYVPRGLPPAAAEAMRLTLKSVAFRGRLRRAVVAVVRRHRSLRRITIRLSR
jgi:hypothetical protein